VGVSLSNGLIGAALAWASLTSAALAGGPVYKDVDTQGNAIYTDRPAKASSKAITNRVAPPLSGPAYDAAVLRAESDRIALERNRLENLQPRKSVTYSAPPGYSQQPSPMPTPFEPYSPRWSRWDPNLPPSPAPSLERNYNYNGR
jgi:hypothetical protein